MTGNHIIKENKIGVLNFILIWLFFYIELLQGGIATHDELGTIGAVIEGNYKFILSARWGMSLFHYPITLLQSSMPNYALYRMWTIVGLMIACLSAMSVIYHHIDKNLCWIYPNVFILLAQTTLDHNGLFAFNWGYQLDIALVFIAIDCFILYKKTHKKKYKMLSIASYFVATMAYEAFAAFGVFFLIIDILYMYTKRNLKLRVIINDLVWHFLAVFSYTVSFIVLSFFYETGDATIGNEVSIVGYLRTLTSYSIGLFPLRFNMWTFKQLMSYAFVFSWKNIVLWLAIIFFVKTIVDYIQKSQPVSLKKYMVYSGLSLVGIILPNVVISMTSKFQQWTLEGVKIFGTSYYSYFFLVFWIVVTVTFIYGRIKSKKNFYCAIFIVFGLMARFTISCNNYYLGLLSENQNRYEAFMDIIKTEDFSKLPKNAQIYTADYIGIHYYIDTLSSLATSVSGNQVRVVNDKVQLDWNMPVYYLEYDRQMECLYLYEMTLDEGIDA